MAFMNIDIRELLVPNFHRTLPPGGCKPNLTLHILHHYCGASSVLPALLLNLVSHTLSELSGDVTQSSIAPGLPNFPVRDEDIGRTRLSSFMTQKITITGIGKFYTLND